MKKVIFDTDGGGDDLWALLLLVDAHNCNEIELIGVTTCYGNVPLNQASKNVLNFLYHCGVSDIPVFKGASKTLSGLPGLADDAFGKTGLSKGSLPESDRDFSKITAHDFLIDVLSNTDGDISIISTGPATNIARVFQDNPILDRANIELLWFGGAILPAGGDHHLIIHKDGNINRGNITPFMEFNAGNDAPASKIITNLKNVSVTIMPMDQCQHTVVTSRHQDDLIVGMDRIGKKEVGENLVAFLQDVIELDKMKQKMDGTPVYDAQTIQYFLDSELFIESTPIQSVEFVDKSQLVTDFLAASEFSPHLLSDHGLMSITPCDNGQTSNIRIVGGPYTFSETPSKETLNAHIEKGAKRADALVQSVVTASKNLIFT